MGASTERAPCGHQPGPLSVREPAAPVGSDQAARQLEVRHGGQHGGLIVPDLVATPAGRQDAEDRPHEPASLKVDLKGRPVVGCDVPTPAGNHQ